VTNTRNVSISILLLTVSLALWEAVVRGFDVPVFILPLPSKVAVALYRGLESGRYLGHLKVTLIETILGFVAGSALGFLLGTGVAMNRYVDFLLKWGVIKQKVETSDLITNELIDETNQLDVAKVVAEAKAYRYSR